MSTYLPGGLADAREPGPLLAAARDASSIDRPNTRTRKKAHIAVNLIQYPATFWESGGYYADAACAPDRMPLEMTAASLASEIAVEQRCRRKGCASRWPEATR